MWDQIEHVIYKARGHRVLFPRGGVDIRREDVDALLGILRRAGCEIEIPVSAYYAITYGSGTSEYRVTWR